MGSPASLLDGAKRSRRTCIFAVCSRTKPRKDDLKPAMNRQQRKQNNRLPAPVSDHPTLNHPALCLAIHLKPMLFHKPVGGCLRRKGDKVIRMPGDIVTQTLIRQRAVVRNINLDRASGRDPPRRTNRSVRRKRTHEHENRRQTDLGPSDLHLSHTAKSPGLPPSPKGVTASRLLLHCRHFTRSVLPRNPKTFELSFRAKPRNPRISPEPPPHSTSIQKLSS